VPCVRIDALFPLFFLFSSATCTSLGDKELVRGKTFSNEFCASEYVRIHRFCFYLYLHICLSSLQNGLHQFFFFFFLEEKSFVGDKLFQFWFHNSNDSRKLEVICAWHFKKVWM
jgi:hypothetical protein